MASWLARSIADSLRLDDDSLGQQDQYEEDGPRPDSDGDDRSDAAVPDRSSTSDRDGDGRKESSQEGHARGVKEDLEELKQSLTRQFLGVSNLIAPPPSSSVSPLDAWDREGVEEESGEDNDEEELVVVGVKEEVLNFASNIAMHPETWLDFPLDPDEDLDDFEMSEAQQEHVLAIESFSPRLRALRIELCPCHMSESYFWKVYFVLLHSRLDKQDSEILSTPQVMEARALWMQELHKQTKMESDWLGRSIYHMKTYSDSLGEDFPSSPRYAHSGGLPFRSFDFETVKSFMSRNSDSERCLSLSSETQRMGESAMEENSAADTKDNDPPLVSLSKIHVQKFEDEEDDVWPEDEDSHLVRYNLGIIHVGSEEDVSFSDLEDDEGVTLPIKSKPPPEEQQGNINDNAYR